MSQCFVGFLFCFFFKDIFWFSFLLGICTVLMLLMLSLHQMNRFSFETSLSFE